MRLDFWRGIIAGSLLGVIVSAMGSRDGSQKRNLLGKIYTRRTRSKTRQFIKGFTRTVGDIIK